MSNQLVAIQRLRNVSEQRTLEHPEISLTTTEVEVTCIAELRKPLD